MGGGAFRAAGACPEEVRVNEAGLKYEGGLHEEEWEGESASGKGLMQITARCV